MGKIVIPKNSALLKEVEAAIKIYYEADDWVTNEEYKIKLKEMIGDDQYQSSYTKKIQVASYYGFVEWQDISNEKSPRRITESGKVFYEHILKDDSYGILDDIMNALEKVVFGRNNYGCPESDSDVEPPVVFIRSIIDLGYVTYKEFSYILWLLEDRGSNYTDVIRLIRAERASGTLEFPRESQKYTDPKAILILKRWGFVDEITGKKQNMRFALNPVVAQKYMDRLHNLKIYNIDKDIYPENSEEEVMDMKALSAEVKLYEPIPDDLSVEQLGHILGEMYSNAEEKMKVAAIHMFAIKYGKVIVDKEYKTADIVAASGINKSYASEVFKGINIYRSLSLRRYGMAISSGQEEITASIKKEKKNILPPRLPRQESEFALNSILYGAPGTGKTFATAEIAVAMVEKKTVLEIQTEYPTRSDLMARYAQYIEEKRILFTTFHQSYGYEDFIQGLRPDPKSDKLAFVPYDGVLKRIADRAMHDQDKDYVIIIDEINRANISKVFGELITLIEEDKRWGERNALSVTLPSGDRFAVPNNLFILGTMNSADKSISLIDTALRRRFDFVEMVPNGEKIEDPTLRMVFEKLNTGLVSELESTDLLIGHAYFIGKTAADLCQIMNRSIIPLLYEYFYDSSKKVENQLKSALTGLDVAIVNNPFGRIKLIEKEQ